jgi:PhnB protein
MNAPKNTSPPTIQPYLFFDGRSEEAINFYKSTLGAEVLMLSRFKDSPDPASCGGADPNKVMHATVRVRDSIILISDGNCTGAPKFSGFALSLTVRDAAEAEKFFAALGQGGQVQMPLTETFFSPRFGMLADKFGVSWMIYVHPPNQK